MCIYDKVYIDKCLHGAAPSYPTEMCTLVMATTYEHLDICCCLHWNDNIWTAQFCSLWTLCVDLLLTPHASSVTLSQFQSRLKTLLFCSAYRIWLGVAW